MISNMRIVIGFVGTIALTGIIAMAVLAIDHVAIPEVFPTVTVAALTGLVGLLARPDGNGAPQA